MIGFFILKSSSTNNKFKNISNNSDNVSVPTDIYLFYVTWCPHCKSALPKWKSFSDSINGTVVNGSLINTHTIDCTNAEDPTVIHYLNKFDVKGYPTVKGVNNNRIVNFDTKINENTLKQFVEELTV
jgi:thiol-disulfide isomerase/thioredoxin